jgi:hypothetical protein
LVYIGKWVNHPNFSLEVLLTSEEELRIADGKGSWRRKGISIVDRRLKKVYENHLFTSPADYKSMIPSNLASPFSNHQIANSLGIPYRLASKMTYTLKQIGVLELDGKPGKPYLFYLSSDV